MKTATLSRRQDSGKKGRGITSAALSLLRRIPVGAVLNRAIDALPYEFHLPGGYQYCGPGTKLAKRLARGDPGINKLDQACKEHDIAYSKFADSTNRSIADRALAEKAWQRVKSSDASIAEKAAAWAVTTAMKTKAKFGGGRRRGRKPSKKEAAKRGGNIKRRRRTNPKRKVKKTSIWSMVKNGSGLYLRPYRVY